jgi:hypothetical protein
MISCVSASLQFVSPWQLDRIALRQPVVESATPGNPASDKPAHAVSNYDRSCPLELILRGEQMPVCRDSPMSTTISSLRRLTADMPASLARVGREPSVRRATELYLAAMEDVKSIDDFMRNDRVYNYALKAFGLEDMAFGKAFIRRVLTEGIDDPDSMANRLTDTRFRELVETFNFARYGATATTFSRTKEGVVDRYLSQSLEEEAGQSSEGLRLALYFGRKASSVTSAYGLMGDRALLKVTQVALGLSESTSALAIERQKKMIDDRLDIADLKDPGKLDKFLTRFAALWDMAQPQQSTSPVVDLFAGSSSASMTIDLLQQIQNIARRG